MDVSSTFSVVAECMLNGQDFVTIDSGVFEVTHASFKDLAMCRFHCEGKWYRAIQVNPGRNGQLALLARGGNKIVRILVDATGEELAYVLNGHVVFVSIARRAA